jgi:DNA replication protein DnaC
MKAEELQEKLDAKRVEVAKSRVKALKPHEVSFDTEAGVGECSKCGAEFEFQAIRTRGGQLHRGGLCDPCYMEWRKQNPEEVRVDDTLQTPATRIAKVLEEMDRLGCNVRRHGHLTLDQLRDSTAKARAQEFVKEFLRAGAYREVRGLYLWGITGTGKSQVAVSTVRTLIEAGVSSKAIVYDRARAMITQLQDCYGKSSVDAFSERRRRCKLWVYEDAGTEKLTQDAYRILEDIIDRREGHPTIITSNKNREDLAARWHEVAGWERFQSRLAPFRSAKMDGSDQRFED